MNKKFVYQVGNNKKKLSALLSIWCSQDLRRSPQQSRFESSGLWCCCHWGISSWHFKETQCLHLHWSSRTRQYSQHRSVATQVEC